MKKQRSHANGFTLIELIFVVAIITLIASLVVPSMVDHVDKAKQKRTLADMRVIATAVMSWQIDHAGPAAAGRKVFDTSRLLPATHAQLEDILVPNYLDSLPDKDGWGFSYEFYFCRQDARGLYVENLGIRSLGRDGQVDGEVSPLGAFDPTDYDRDIIWLDSYFVQWPGDGGVRPEMKATVALIPNPADSDPGSDSD